MAASKIHRYHFKSLKRRERPCAYQKCLFSKPELKIRSCKNWLTIFLLIITLHYVLFKKTYFWVSDGLMAIGNSLADRGDEYLTPNIADDSNKTAKHVADLNDSQLPSCETKQLSGTFAVNISGIDMSQLNITYPLVKEGGYYHPPNCSTKNNVAIIIPYSGPESILNIFLYNIHPFLMAQQLEYQIFIIEQSGTKKFNRGRLYNVGIQEVIKLEKFQCMVFHDLELLPSNMEIPYSCAPFPRLLSSSIDDNKIRKRRFSNEELMSGYGAVVSMTMDMVVKSNGFSNEYTRQANEIFWRLRAVGFSISKLNKSVGVFTVIQYKQQPLFNSRYHLVKTVKGFKSDGLANLKYVIISKSAHHLYSHILVDIDNEQNDYNQLKPFRTMS